MKRTLLYPAILCTLVLGLALVLPQSASAGCTGICADVGGGCKRCQDAGEYTGTACDDVGSCFCMYVQCAESQSASLDEVDWSDVLPVEPLLPETAASPAPCPEAGELSEPVEAAVKS